MKNAHLQTTKVSATLTSSILKSPPHKSKLNKFAHNQPEIFNSDVNEETLSKSLKAFSTTNFREGRLV